jgi:hypothetical protein
MTAWGVEGYHSFSAFLVLLFNLVVLGVALWQQHLLQPAGL